MAIRIDRTRLASERRRRLWSQEQLAAVSGVSVRTIQRLEQGRAASSTSLAALSSALAIPDRALVADDQPVRRITPLAIVDDMREPLWLYRGIGFALIHTDDPGYVGLRAGHSHMILCTLAFLRADFRCPEIAALVGRTLPYVWVRSLDEAKAGHANLIEETETRAGTREALVEHGGQWAILAETAR